MTEARYAYDDLLRFARVLLERTGLDTDKARAVADILVEADLLGHDTHGLNLLASFMILLTTSAPDNAGVAPHGGQRGVMTPNPIAAAWPTGGDPVLVDVSVSLATNLMTARLQREGKRYPGQWVIDSEGHPTDDPAVMFGEPRGAMLPLGGVDAGHKGYALGLLVEALSGGLPGHARADPQEGWVGNVFLEIFDPASFGGLHDFVRQMAFLSNAVHATPPRPGFDRVRLPGERGLQLRREQLAAGVRLHAGIMGPLTPWAEKLGVPLPAARTPA